MTEPTTSLPGTVKYYERHLFVCTGQADWPERVELGGGFLQALAEMIGLYAAEMPLKVKMTACDDPGLTDTGYDILVFPDMVRYVGLETADIPRWVLDFLVGNKVRASGRFLLTHEPLTGHHIFVCVHGRRDQRCGQCGPPLVQRLETELSKRELTGSVTVHRTSHVGGHAFAGNVLIYPSGDWYGYVTPQDIPRLVEDHLVGGVIVKDLWRGRMGVEPSLAVELLSGSTS